MPVTNRIPLHLLMGLAALAAPLWATAAESYDNCTGFIDSVPATISTQGTWCLRRDVNTGMQSGVAISIETNNVTIDCNDFKIGGLAAGPGTAAQGIVAYERLNATIRHCNVRGFSHGILLFGANGGGHIVEDNRLDSNTFFGAVVVGDGSVVRRNQINDTGDSTTMSPHAYGISTVGSVDVIDNVISGVIGSTVIAGDDDGYGIFTHLNPNGSITGNRIRGVVGFENAVAYGIFNSGADRISVVGNHIAGNGSFHTGTGIACSGSGNGQAKDNLVSGFSVAIEGCGSNGDVVGPSQ